MALKKIIVFSLMFLFINSLSFSKEKNPQTVLVKVDDMSKVFAHLNHQILSQYNNTHPRPSKNPIEVLNDFGANSFLSLRLIEEIQKTDDFDYYKSSSGSKDVEVDRNSLGFKHFQLLFSLVDPFLPTPAEYEIQRKENPAKTIYNEACFLRKKWEVHRFITMEGSGPPNYWSNCGMVYDPIYKTSAWQDYKNAYDKAIFEQIRRDIYTIWEQKAYKQAQRDCLAVVAVPALFLGAVGLGSIFLASAAEMTTVQLLARYALIGAITGGAYGALDGVLVEELHGLELAIHSLISAGFGAATFVAFGAALKLLRISSLPASKQPSSNSNPQRPNLTLYNGGGSRPAGYSSGYSSGSSNRYTGAPARMGRSTVNYVGQGQLALDQQPFSVSQPIVQQEHLLLVVDNEAIQTVLNPVFSPLEITIPAGISTLIITDLPEDILHIQNPDLEIFFPGEDPEGMPTINPEEPKEDGDLDQDKETEIEVEFERPIEMPYLPYYPGLEEFEAEYENDFGSYYYPLGYENPYELSHDQWSEIEFDYPYELPYEYPLFTPAEVPDEEPFHFGEEPGYSDIYFPGQYSEEEIEYIVFPNPNIDSNEPKPIIIEIERNIIHDQENMERIFPLEIRASIENNGKNGGDMDGNENIKPNEFEISDEFMDDAIQAIDPLSPVSFEDGLLKLVHASTSSDIEEIIAVGAECGHPLPQYALTFDIVKKDMAKGINFFILKYKNEPIAFISYAIDNDENESEIVHLGVLSSESNKGIGKFLYSLLEGVIIKQGLDSLYLWTWSGNEKAIRFWMSQGYEMDKVSKKHYDGGEEAVLFRKKI
ncbi:MAG: GNAT family N-acetyltransferase [Pseudomonadota bacterium]